MRVMVTQLFLGRCLSSILSDLILLMDYEECRVCFVDCLGVFDGTACEMNYFDTKVVRLFTLPHSHTSSELCSRAGELQPHLII